jgi:RimJ/RimL family protein N-acetyltransferase
VSVPELTTSRLRIRRFVVDDLDAAAALLDGCFGPEPREVRAAWLEWTVRNYEQLAALKQPPYGDYAVERRDGGELIGSVGLVPLLGPFGRVGIGDGGDAFVPEIGLFWTIDPRYRGHGYAGEAASALASDAFDSLRVRRLLAMTERDNAVSIAVMRKLGMTVREHRGAPEWLQIVGVLER